MALPASGRSDLGATLRRLRQSRLMSVAQVAALIGVPVYTVYNWERGAARVPTARLEALSELFGPSVDLEPPSLLPPVGDPPSLARFRIQLELSQVAAARLLGISRSSLRGYESGRPLPLAQLRRMAVVYDIPLVELAAAGGVRCPRELDLKSWQPGDLGRVLRVLREWSGLTQAALALQVGASKDAVRAWENDRHQPGAPLRRKLEELYRLPIGVLRRAYTRPARSHRLSAATVSSRVSLSGLRTA
jgi:transcriptional regulator with XRE-family HTH domain